jgi:hypothetical protein
MQPLQVIAAVVFQGKRLPQPQKTDPRYVSSRVAGRLDAHLPFVIALHL